MKTKLIKITYIFLAIMAIIPSIIYLMQNHTVEGFSLYYNFFINKDFNKIISTILYLIIFIAMSIIYIVITKKKIFNNIKQVLTFTSIVAVIFMIMLPWTSSDIFYYMGVGELDSKYNQNPYYISIEEYYNQNSENIVGDEILEQGKINYWADTTVVYGPISQMIFKICTGLSFKNIDICIFLFKLLNVIVHLINCYLIYKITKKLKFSILYGLNPFILLEFIGNVHNDIIVTMFILLSLYFILKKKNIFLSVVFLAIATGMKYYSILLLPIIVLYHFKKEEKISKRILKCIQYGVIFLLIMGVEYLVYFRDTKILSAMLVQTERYCKSIYSSICVIKSGDVAKVLKELVLIFFIVQYIKFCIDLLTTKKIKFYEIIKKYNNFLILFLLCLTNFQQWYIIWLFATIMWQKPNMIKNIVGLSLISEIGNSVYMFKAEHYKYDTYFVLIIACLFIIWQIITNKKKRRKQIENIVID